MPTPLPPEHTRFQSGNKASRSGPKRSRDKLSSKFLHELAEHFEKNGKAAIEALYQQDVGRYVAAIVNVIPKQVEVGNTFDGLTGDKLTEAIETLTNALQSRVTLPEEPEERPALNS